jgi:hypothetical protein
MRISYTILIVLAVLWGVLSLIFTLVILGLAMQVLG